MKTVFHVGSMPAEQVSKLQLDGLDRRPNDDWRDHVRTICLPRYVIQASPARIARHFDNLDEVITDTENRHLRTRTWYRAGLEEPEEGARIMTAKEFFGEED